MELKYLLMWLLFGSVKGNKPEKCPSPLRIEFADVTADAYPLETKLYYECDSGYTRKSGQYLGIQCQNIQGVASWVYKDFQCIDMKVLLSTTPMMVTRFNSETKPQNSALQKPENCSEFDQKDFCGPPKTIPHASLRLKKQYNVGQVLHFKCQSGYDKGHLTSGTSTCKKVDGKIIWTPLKMRCTNDSSYSDEWSSQTPEPGSTHPSFSSSVILPVTAIFFVLLIIPAVFL